MLRHICKLNRLRITNTKRQLSTCITKDPGNYKSVKINDAQMSYLDLGLKKDHEKAVVFLHGNPTSSYLWRNVIPQVTGIARCIAPDLIGMGKSQKLPGCNYTFDDHFKYLDGFLKNIDLPSKINLVIHDWGSALGFHWAQNNQDRIESITFMEGFVAPLTWEEFPEIAVDIFKGFRSPAGGEMILQNNFFVEKILPLGMIRKLTFEEMKEYRRPFNEPGELRRPTLTFPREIPFENDGPEHTMRIMKSYNSWLVTTDSLPKLFIKADPGQLTPHMTKRVQSWPNLQFTTVKGLHYLQEDSPEEIGKAIHDFLVTKRCLD